MSGKYKPILIKRVSLWWYPVMLLPILAFGWFSITGLVPAFLVPLSLFALFFWIFSLGFAIAGKLRKPRDPSP